MYTTRLKRSADPSCWRFPAVLKTLELSTDSEVGMTIDNGCLIIEPRNGPVIRLRSCWRSAIRTQK